MRKDISVSDFNNVAVLGTGTLGSQIIMQAAYAGKNVAAYDISDEVLAKLPDRWEWMRGFYRNDLEDFTEEKFDEAIARITPTTDLKAATENADIVIESVPENIDLKHKVYKELSGYVSDDCIVATNSSYLLPSEMALAVEKPERFGALHFANKVWKGNNGEIMGCDSTEPETLDAIEQFAKEINLRPFRVLKEVRGYILNAQLVPLLRNAVTLYANGVASYEDINDSFKVALQYPTGMIEVADTVGFPLLAYAWANEEDPKLREWAAAAGEAVKAGKGGLGDGEGFYKYDEQGNVVGKGTAFPDVWGE